MEGEGNQEITATAARLEDELRQRVESLTYLPGSVAVAVKFVELGKDLDAGPAEYEKTISSDASLGTKILALANSSWYGVRNQVTKVLQAITLLGLANVRTLAISYCMASLHNRVKIPPEAAKRYWEASLCKGVAAKVFAHAIDGNLEDEAFLAGLFQDLALPVIHSVAGDELERILEDPASDTQRLLHLERETFGVDHCEVGRWISAKLELPETYVDAVGFHHDCECLQKFLESDALASAVRLAALFPHGSKHWCRSDVDKVVELLSSHGSGGPTSEETFLAAVQKEFEELYGFFEGGEPPQLRLQELCAEASEEIADGTTRLVGQVRDLMNETAKAGELMNSISPEHQQPAEQGRQDALTGVLNRGAFLEEAVKQLTTVSRHGVPFVMVYLDLDEFKQTNDRYGRHFGDFTLRELASRIRERIRSKDLLGRTGGDEFVLLLTDINPDRAYTILDAILRGIREQPYVKGKVASTQSARAGVLCADGSESAYDAEELVTQASALADKAKRSGPGQMCMQSR